MQLVKTIFFVTLFFISTYGYSTGENHSIDIGGTSINTGQSTTEYTKRLAIAAVFFTGSAIIGTTALYALEKWRAKKIVKEVEMQGRQYKASVDQFKKDNGLVEIFNEDARAHFIEKQGKMINPSTVLDTKKPGAYAGAAKWIDHGEGRWAFINERGMVTLFGQPKAK